MTENSCKDAHLSIAIHLMPDPTQCHAPVSLLQTFVFLQEAEVDDKPCSLCGRRYQHEHVRSLHQKFEDHDGDSDSNSS